MLHYKKYGSAGKILVFLHGFLESYEIWEKLREDLEKLYQIVLIDLPGHGLSQNHREVNTVEEMAEDVVVVLNELSIEKATIIGHSMGGYVACALADLYPSVVENFVLVNSTVLSDDNAKKQQRLKACDVAQKKFQQFCEL